MNAIARACLRSALALLSANACASGASTTPTPAPAPAPDDATPSPAFVGTFTSGADGFDTKTVYFDTGREVVVFDAQFTPAQAEKAIAAIAARTRNPITHVVVSHPNPDKFGGLAAFAARGAKVVASRATRDAMPAVHAYKKAFFVDVARMFREEEFPRLVPVDVAFERATTLALAGGARVELVELGVPGVSGNQTVAWIPSRRTLFVGDLVHHGVHAWLEGGVESGRPRPTLGSWKAALDLLASRFPADARVEGGRGGAAALAEAVPAQKAYLDAADAVVTRYVREVGPRGRAEFSGPGAGAHWAELTRRFQAEFPDRGLVSLVTYGVYGLATAK